MKNKYIIIFRASGPLKNTYLVDKLAKLNYKIEDYPILNVKKIYTKEIKINDNDVVITSSFNVYIIYPNLLKIEFSFYILSAKLPHY